MRSGENKGASAAPGNLWRTFYQAVAVSIVQFMICEECTRAGPQYAWDLIHVWMPCSLFTLWWRIFSWWMWIRGQVVTLVHELQEACVTAMIHLLLHWRIRLPSRSFLLSLRCWLGWTTLVPPETFIASANDELRRLPKSSLLLKIRQFGPQV